MLQVDDSRNVSGADLRPAFLEEGIEVFFSWQLLVNPGYRFVDALLETCLLQVCVDGNENLMNTYHAHPVHTLQEMLRLKASFPDNIKLYVARSETGKMLGGTVLYISRKVVHTQYISASEEGKQSHALDALFQNLIKIRYKDFDYFDFGTSNEEGGKVLNASLIYQKEGVGGRGVV